MADQLWGSETGKAVENFQISGQPVPPPVIHWLGRLKAAAARANAELRRARPEARGRDRQGGRRDRRGQARRPVPGRRLPDRLGDLLEHERERGDREARRRRDPSQRPRQPGPVLQRRLPLRRPPGGPGRGPLRPAAGARRAWQRARAQGRRVRGHRQDRPHPPDGRGPGHPRPGVRRLRQPDQARRRPRPGHAAARGTDPAGRAPRPAPGSTPTPSSPRRCARS